MACIYRLDIFFVVHSLDPIIIIIKLWLCITADFTDTNAAGCPNVKALRKVFASLDRKKTSTLLPPSSDGDSSRLGGDGDHTPNASNAQQINDDGTTLALNTLHVNATKDEVHKISVPEKKDRHKAEPREPTILPSSPGVANNSRTVPRSPTSTTEPVWDFESLLEEQRRREMQYDDQKEKIFEKVNAVGALHVRYGRFACEGRCFWIPITFLGSNGDFLVPHRRTRVC